MTPSSFNCRRLAIATALAVSSVLLAAPMKFDIPTQPMPSALRLFIKQSGSQVMFVEDEVKDARAQAVVGEFEPASALKQLLADTGYAATERRPGWFAVVREKARPGTVTGSVVVRPGGQPVAGARVRVVGGTANATTAADGSFRLESVPAGAQQLVISGEGFAPVRVTDLEVRPGAVFNLTPVEVASVSVKDGVQQLAEMVVSAKKNGDVTELERMVVEGTKVQPFTTSNVDLPRGIDDAQPRFIFDAKAIDLSGANGIEDFLKNRLTMNTSAATGQQIFGAGVPGSQLNLRGLGTNQTLILVNGRRPGNATNITGQLPPYLGDIPLSAIERIDVLPSSASGMYGGSALGGVINIITKRDYVGAEVRTTYENTFSKDTPLRTVSFSAGLALEGGKTQLTLNAQYSDGDTLLEGDRDFFQKRTAMTLTNNPTTYLPPNAAPLGSTPNIRSSNNTPLFGAGTPSYTSVPIGFNNAGLTLAQVLTALRANAGAYNYALPDTLQTTYGTLQPMGRVQQSKSLSASVRRQMTAQLDAFVEFTTGSDILPFRSGFASSYTVAANAPNNPFGQALTVQVPLRTPIDRDNALITHGLTTGFVLKLPREWKAEGEFLWSLNHNTQHANSPDSNVINAAISNGTVDVLRDTMTFAPDLTKYVVPTFTSAQDSSINTAALRAAGPLFSWAAGASTLALGLEHRKEGYGNQLTMNPTNTVLVLGKSQSTNSGYAEIEVPLIGAGNARPGLRQVALQLAGRTEDYHVRTGTASIIATPPATLPTNPVLVSNLVNYRSTNPTIGGTYRPIQDVMLRASYSTAFVPPTYAQLQPSAPPTTFSSVVDPRRGNTTNNTVLVQAGGNTNLQPEKAKNWNAGFVFEPRFAKGLRFSLDYTRIDKTNALNTPTAQVIVNNESFFPGRVTRATPVANDPFGVGAITQVDATTLNLTKAWLETYDLSLTYRTTTERFGAFDFYALATVQPHYKTQAAFGAPLTENIGYTGAALNGSPAVGRKGNAGLTWEYGRWTLGWATRFFHSYHVTSSAAGILSQGNGGLVPAQAYHDVTASYRFGAAEKDARWYGRAFGRMEIQVGVKNVFNKAPPMDLANFVSYYSFYGDPRMADYYVTIKKAF